MSLDCFRHLVHILPQQAAVLATVIATTGSVPREVGAKMFVEADGRIVGTVGGGAGEAKVIQQAQAVLAQGVKQRVTVDLSGNMATQRPTEGICGGTMQVWLERWSGTGAIALLHTLLHTLDSGQSITLVTPLALDQAPYLLPADAPYPPHAFVETLYPPPVLLIIGAGHCGEQLATVAHQIGFQVMVQDDRPEWANPQRYPQAAHIWHQPIAALVGEGAIALAHHTQLYVALVTRGYPYDLDALQALLTRSTPCRYIGMIGSKKRVNQVFHTLQASGVAAETLTQIYAPIGLDIGALTPAEIAVSIAAELILVRRGGSGRSLNASSPNGSSLIENRPAAPNPTD
ncbi:MAG: XdhC family protein [Kaiparowitsia implicata GSE-PSE-MK54-09C]|jgi:xanthine dehydrogenase accessory factor|nr:XdhC family protein [Kaiparowitsia implicata GSE-PSE-MK54-09C]